MELSDAEVQPTSTEKSSGHIKINLKADPNAKQANQNNKPPVPPAFVVSEAALPQQPMVTKPSINPGNIKI